MLTATRRKLTLTLLTALTLLMLASAPVIVPAVHANECPTATSGNC